MADHDPAIVELVTDTLEDARGLATQWERARAVLDALTAAGWRDLSRVSGYLVDGEIHQPRDVELLYRPPATPPEGGDHA